jgi:hypothetical protein
MRPDKDTYGILRVALSMLAILAAGLHMAFPCFIPDSITAGLVILAINEIIRLRDFGLVKKLVDYSLYDIQTSGGLKKYVEITDRGRI